VSENFKVRELFKENEELRAEVSRLRAIAAADYDDAELIRSDAQYLHAGILRHGAIPECAEDYIRQILDRAIAIQKRRRSIG
jgi:DNA-binding NarL/FixJ family response regulator